jgi:hypothetical protein
MNTRLILFLPLIFCLNNIVFSQVDETLCKKNEEIIFIFQLKNQKRISVCKEKEEKYIVYRFGTQKKIELQYPVILDSTSWQQFTFNGNSRGGGKQNAAMYFGFLEFINDEVKYEVYQTWNSEDDIEHCGIMITVGGKQTDLKGLLKTKKGTLLDLLYNEKVKKQD